MSKLLMFCFSSFIYLFALSQTAVSLQGDTVNKKKPLNSFPSSSQDYKKQSLRFDQNYSKEYYRKGNAKYATGDYRGAISDYTEEIEFNPGDMEAYYYRAFARYKIGDKTGACADWNKASSLGMKKANDTIKKYCR